MRRNMFRSLMPTFAAVLFFAVVASPARNRTEPLPWLKLYVFDCGAIHVPNTEVFSLKKQEVATTDLAVPMLSRCASQRGRYSGMLARYATPCLGHFQAYHTTKPVSTISITPYILMKAQLRDAVNMMITV